MHIEYATLETLIRKRRWFGRFEARFGFLAIFSG